MKNHRTRPIGIFDSGLGGLTVLKDIVTELPHENIVYFGDSGRAPYGSKSPETVIRFSLQNTRFLIEQQVKLIVIACNTASSRAFEAVRKATDIPVIEVIDPGAKAAAAATKNGRVGIIGTRGTIESGVYPEAIHRYKAEALIFQKACPLFVSLAEEGWWDQPVTREIAEIYLDPLIEKNIDTLVLGCTHYPLLSRVIADVMGSRVTLIQAGREVARLVKAQLAAQDLLNLSEENGIRRYFTSDSVEQFRKLGGAFLSQTLDEVTRVDFE